MKTIGLLGGMSWESTALYYKSINEGISDKLGSLHSAKIVLISVDFDEIEKLQHLGKWNELAVILKDAALNIEGAGADFLVICTNTMHKVLHYIQEYLEIPVLHIADTTASELTNDKITKVGLLGTAFTMEQDFYKNRVIEKHGIEVIVPNTNSRKIVHDIIYNELCLGKINKNSKEEYLKVIDELKEQGAQAIILGCTEITMLIKQSDTDIKLYDTTSIHANAAVLEAIK